VSRSVARDEFDASLARYEPCHAVTIPRADPDPWETILLDRAAMEEDQ